MRSTKKPKDISLIAFKEEKEFDKDISKAYKLKKERENYLRNQNQRK